MCRSSILMPPSSCSIMAEFIASLSLSKVVVVVV